MKEVRVIAEELFNLIEKATTFDDLIIIGELRDSFSTVKVYNSNSVFFSTILITETSDRLIKRVSFSGDKFKITLTELISIFGGYEYAYNFRDNYTGFFFSNAKGTKILKVYCEKDNNFKNEYGYFSEYTSNGMITDNLTEDMIVFDNIIFNVKFK